MFCRENSDTLESKTYVLLPEAARRSKLKTFPHSFRLLFRFAAVLGAVAGVTAIDVWVLHANSPTAAFSFLLLVLALATRAGLKETILASLASTLAYNFFFLPPVGTLTIDDPQNWVALFVFLATAITVSHLSNTARRKTEEAASRERELQRMYDFSRALMLRESAQRLTDQVTHKISEIFQVQDVSFYDCASDSVRRITATGFAPQEAALREVAASGVAQRDSETAAVIVPVRFGGPSLGSIGIVGNISEVAVQAITQLVAIALERARVQEREAHAQAARENEQLKSTLLDALAHEFKTPLTSIKAAATTVLSRDALDETERDLLTVVDEEVDRLNELVSEAIELARIGAGPVKLQREPCSVGALISSAVTRLKRISAGRIPQIIIDPDVPDLALDRRLIELALRQLLDNALKYSFPQSPIQVTAKRESDEVVLRVSSTAVGIPKAEQALIFEKFYRGRDVRGRVPGMGMGLAIVREIIEAHGGRIGLKSEPGKEVQFSFTLPILPAQQTAKDQKTHTVA